MKRKQNLYTKAAREWAVRTFLEWQWRGSLWEQSQIVLHQGVAQSAAVLPARPPWDCYSALIALCEALRDRWPDCVDSLAACRVLLEHTRSLVSGPAFNRVEAALLHVRIAEGTIIEGRRGARS